MGISGLAGVLAFHDGWNVVRFLRYSLRALSHRGIGKYWIAVAQGGVIKAISTSNLDLVDAEGPVGIGCSPTEEGSFGSVRCGEVWRVGLRIPGRSVP
jgi:amidophosphoribosyltransferase